MTRHTDRSQKAAGMAGTVVLLLVISVLIAVPLARADTNSFFTRYSSLRIVDRDDDLQELVSDGWEDNWYSGWSVPGTGNWRLAVETAIPWRPDTDVVVLLRLEISNACTGWHQFVVVPEIGYPWATEASETCALGTLAMRVSHDAIEIDTIAVSRPDLSHVTFRFDGEGTEEIEVARDDSGAEIAGADADVTRWIGTHPARILDESSERRRFGSIMPPEDLHELVRNTYVAVPGDTRTVDGILVAWGCRPHNCPYEQGGIAIEVPTGRPYAVTCSEEHGVRVFGGKPSEIPEPLRAIGARKCIFWRDTN